MGSTRQEIEDMVETEKAISFTELKEETGRSNGVIQYHVNESNKLEKKNGAILEKGQCSNCSFSDQCESECLIKSLRKPMNIRIIELLEQQSSLKEISEHLDIDISTAHYHTKKLQTMGILEGKRPVPAARKFLKRKQFTVEKRSKA